MNSDKGGGGFGLTCIIALWFADVQVWGYLDELVAAKRNKCSGSILEFDKLV